MSATPSCVWDIPEPVFRIIHHGRHHTQNLEASLVFLARHEPTIFAQPCETARNALFFAIREGRDDAVRFLASLRPWAQPGSLFNSPYNRWDRCKEINGLLYRRRRRQMWQREMSLGVPISKKKQLQLMLANARAEGEARTPPDSPLLLDSPLSPAGSPVRLPLSEGGFDATNDDSYEDPDEDSDLDTGFHIIEDACLHFQGERRHFWGRRRKSTNYTTLPYHHDHHGPPMSSGSTDGLDSTIGDHCSSRPTNYRQMEGVVDAVLTAILYDKRNVLDLLLAGAAKATMQTGDQFPCFVGSVKQYPHYNDNSVKAMAEKHSVSNLVSYFPVQVWESCVMIGNPDGRDFESFDGIIRYPLMYMTAITASIHRDIQLAYEDSPSNFSRTHGSGLTRVRRILLSAMPEANSQGPCGWVAESQFESACLSLNDDYFDEPPLYLASARRWDELAVLLMEQGANPQAPARNSVLKRLGSQDRIDDGRVQNLLMLALRSGVGKIVTTEDVNMFIEKYQGFSERDHPVSWKSRKRHRILCWEGRYESLPAGYIALWEAISAANRAQHEKIWPPSPTSTSYDATRNPILAAALYRDLVALQHLLLLDFHDAFHVNTLHETRFRWDHWDHFAPQHRNRGWYRFVSCYPRVTLLDLVSWTANVEPSRCSSSGLRLKAHDARIASFLISQGAVRGPDYVFETLLVKVLLQHVLPPVALPLVGYCLYLSGTWVAVVLPQANEMTEAAQNLTGAADKATRPVSAMFILHCIAAISIPVIMLYHFFHTAAARQSGARPNCPAIVWPTIWFVLIAGTLANLIALSVLGTGSEAGRFSAQTFLPSLAWRFSWPASPSCWSSRPWPLSLVSRGRHI